MSLSGTKTTSEQERREAWIEHFSRVYCGEVKLIMALQKKTFLSSQRFLLWSRTSHVLR